MALLLLTLGLFLFSNQSHAYSYGEHKDIGDEAFRVAAEKMVLEGAYMDRDDMKKFLSDVLRMKMEPDGTFYYFDTLSQVPNQVTYGTLNALSGDHEADPLTLESKLHDKNSTTNKILFLHDKYIKEFQTGAPDMELFDADFLYGFLALVNYSHFYDYTRTLDRHLQDVDLNVVKNLFEPKNVPEAFSKISKSHAINAYITLHAFAVALAEKAGKEFRDGLKKQAAIHLYYAILFNGYADHFLEDAFAAGHLVVNRTIIGSIINNKNLHDFYNDVGLKVGNLKGDIWVTHGDNALNRPDELWNQAHDYTEGYFDVKLNSFLPGNDCCVQPRIRITKKYSNVVNAVSESILEVWQGFDRARKTESFQPFLERAPKDRSKIPAFLIAEFEPLSLMPVPYGTDVEKYDVPKEKLEDLTKATQLVTNRNFVRSRVANSLMFTIGNYFGKTDNFTLGARFNLSAKLHWYQDRENKAGTIDQWIGTTYSYDYAFSTTANPSSHKMRMGGTYNADFWLWRSGYLGVYSFLEGGADIRKDPTKSDVHFVAAPTLGLQPLSLIGWDNFTLPYWASIPLQFLLPVKFSFTYNWIWGIEDDLSYKIDIDLLF